MSDRPSSKKNDPDNIFDDFDEPPEPSTPAQAQPNGSRSSSSVDEPDAFEDIGAEPDVIPRRGRDEVLLEEEEISEAQPESRGNPLLSKLITVGGAAVMLVGGGLLINSQFGLTDMLFGGDTSSPPVAQAPPPAVLPPNGPRTPVASVPEQPSTLRLPPPTVQPPPASLPTQAAPSATGGNIQTAGQMSQQPAVGMNRPQTPTPSPAGGSATSGAPAGVPSVVSMQVPQVAASQAPILEVQVALNTAISRIQENQRETNREVALALQTGLNEIARSVITRFDRFEGSLDGMRQAVDGFGERVSTIEGRLSSLEETCSIPRTASTNPQPSPSSASVTRPQSTASAPSAPPRPAAPQSQAKPNTPTPSAQAPSVQAPVPTQPAAAQTALRGWQLRGVSQSAALLQTPSGQMQRVEMGEDVQGLGTVREIRREGDSFVLVTSRGLVRP